MYFEDLSPYEYLMVKQVHNILNVGWLDIYMPFPKGEVPREVVEKLLTIISREGNFEARVRQLRGSHPCHLCGLWKFSNLYVGSCELWIPSIEKDMLFAAPSMIIHYIENHNYCPPKVYHGSVMQLDIDCEFNAQEVYTDICKKLANIK